MSKVGTRLFFGAAAFAAALLLSGCAERLAPELKALNLEIVSENERQLTLKGRDVCIELTSGSARALVNGVPVTMPDAVIRSKKGRWSLPGSSASNILAPLIVRRRISVHRILLDPGHGGSDPGARGVSGQLEKQLNLLLALQLKTELEKLGFTVYMTRNGDENVALNRRGGMAKTGGADLLLSIHHNSSKTNPAAAGMETYALAPAGDAEVSRMTGGVVLAWLIQKEQSGIAGNYGRGVKFARFRVLREADCPAILVEIGFLSNAEEERLCSSSEYRERIAAAISRAVKSFVAP